MSSLDFGIALNLAFNVFKEEMHAALAQEGFDDLGPSFGYVFRLLEDGPRKLRDVAEHLGITAPGALKIVDDMVSKGYVERSDDPEDGRVKQLMLTSRGRQVLAAARRFHARFEAALVKRIGKTEVAACRTALESIAARASSAARPI